MKDSNWLLRRGISAILILAVLLATLSWPGQEASQAQSVQNTEPEWYKTLQPWQPGFPVALSASYLH